MGLSDGSSVSAADIQSHPSSSSSMAAGAEGEESDDAPTLVTMSVSRGSDRQFAFRRHLPNSNTTATVLYRPVGLVLLMSPCPTGSGCCVQGNNCSCVKGRNGRAQRTIVILGGARPAAARTVASMLDYGKLRAGASASEDQVSFSRQLAAFYGLEMWKRFCRVVCRAATNV